MFRFEKLSVWKRAVKHAGAVYSATRTFPPDERFGLTNQLRRAAFSISSNIAEGSGRVSDTDFARFLEIAYGSLMEVVSQLTIANEQGFLNKESYDALYQESEELSRMLSGLRSTLITKSKRKLRPNVSMPISGS